MDLAFLKKTARLAVTGSLAVGIIAYSGMAHADSYKVGGTPGAGGAYELNSDNPVTINVGTTVDELVTVTTTDMNFGTIGIHQDKTGGTKATIVLDPTTGLLTDSHTGATARIVADSAAGSVSATKTASVAIAGAFPTAAIYVHYTTVVDLACASGTCTTTPLEQGGVSSPYTAPTLLLTHITDDMGTMGATGDLGTAGTAGSCNETAPATCTSTDGHATTTNAGTLTFHIGGTLSTDGTAKYYASGVYSGSFNLTLSY